MQTTIFLFNLDGTNGFRLDGVDANDYSGRSVSGIGDFNGDGFDDFIIGADRADAPGETNNGESYVVFGKASGFVASIDLANLNGTDGFRLDGVDGDMAGRSVSGAGDVNGDGLADLIIGADGRASSQGANYVVFGQASPTASFDLATLDGADGFRFDGDAAGDLSGRAVSSAGDVNGDGFADLIFSGEMADPDGVSNAGESYVVFGRASGFTATLDPDDLDGTDGFRLEGVDMDDRSGASVGAVDINGDGLDDVIVGAFAADPDGVDLAGESYVIFGRTSGFAAAIDLGGLDPYGSEGFRLDGIDAIDRAGISVSGAGDFNGDGVEDLAVGAFSGDPLSRSNAGETYVFFGKTAPFAAEFDLATLDGMDGFNIYGARASYFAGRTVSSGGDINGDGFDDLLVGASGAGVAYNVGATYVVFGRASGAISVDLFALDSSQGFSIFHNTGYDYGGIAVSGAGDINGDGFDDVIVGARGGDANGSNSGESSIIFGFDSGAVTTMGSGGDDSLTGDMGDNVLVGGGGDDVLTGGGGQDALRGGGGDDILVVASTAFRRVDGGLGEDTLRLAAGVDLDLTQAGVAVREIEAIDLAGANSGVTLDARTVLNLSETSNSVAISGVGTSTATLTDAGWNRVVDGGTTTVLRNGQAELVIDSAVQIAAAANIGVATVDLAALDGADGFRLDGIDALDRSGASVSDAGDVNGDGFDDLIVGAFLADLGGDAAAGESYVVFGQASGFSASLDLAALNGANGFRLDGIDATDYSGVSVSGAGDVNGDGFADLIIGASFADQGDTNTGESYVVFGQASGFSASLDLAALNGANGFRLDGIDAFDESGRSVSGAGDVNGDGFADLIIGAYTADQGDTNTGESYVVFGQASGFSASLDLAALNGANGFRLDGIDAFDESGRSVSGAGDVNGDGFADLIIGAYTADQGDTNTGESYVVFGQASGFSASLDLAALNGANGFRLDGVDFFDLSGRSVSGAGDVNGDGFADVIIGAYNAFPGGDTGAGESYVVFGQASGFSASLDLAALNGANGFRLDGVDDFDFSGRSVSGAGDVNGDGFDDLIIGADSANPAGVSNAGESYVVFGQASGFSASLNLAALNGANGFRLDGIDALDRSGRSVSGAGDVNGDGFDDLIIDAAYADPGGDASAGESYVVFGVDSGAVSQAGGAGADMLSGSGGIDVFVGGGGDDLLIGGGGEDALRGGSGDDVLAVASDAFRRADGGLGTDTLRIAADGLQLDLTGAGNNGVREVEAVDLAGAGAGVVVDALAVRNLSETSNSLRVTGDGTTALTLEDAGWAVSGDDMSTRTFANGTADVVVDRMVGLVAIGDGGADELRGIDGDDRLSALGGADQLFGEGGDDILEGGLGGDLLQGGDGVDIASYVNSAARVVVNLGTGFRSGGDASGDTFNSIEGLRGSALNDTLVGSSGANMLMGDAGRDTLRGESGDDMLEGGAGFDRLMGGAGVDIANYTDSAARVVINLGSGFRSGGDASGDTFDSIEGLGGSAHDDILVGTSAANRLLGRDGRDTLRGEGGDDTLEGGLGPDVLIGGDGVDIASYASSAARVVINLGAGFRSGGDAVGDSFNGIEGLEGSAFNDVLVGTAAADRLYGGDGPDTLRGEGGDDVLEGGAGADQLIGGADVDIASYASSAARVVINLGTGFRSGGDAAGDSYNGIEGLEGSAFNDVLVGDGGASRLFGRDGRDTLRGEGGDDTLEGGAGPDTLVGGAGEDTASYAGSEARVVINLGSGYRSGGDSTGDTFNGIEGLEGSAFNDILVGAAGANVLTGGDGDDQLRGEAGDDVLTGGDGDDVMTGGLNADTFVLGLGSAIDTIADFDVGVDTIDISAYGFADFNAVLAATTDVGGRAQIALNGAQDVLRLTGVLEANLQGGDFLL